MDLIREKVYFISHWELLHISMKGQLNPVSWWGCAFCRCLSWVFSSSVNYSTLKSLFLQWKFYRTSTIMESWNVENTLGYFQIPGGHFLGKLFEFIYLEQEREKVKRGRILKLWRFPARQQAFPIQGRCA